MASNKDQSHKVGSDIGRWLYQEGETYDLKDLDQAAYELLEDIEVRRQATNSEAFIEGVASGYMLEDAIQDQLGDPPSNRGKKR